MRQPSGPVRQQLGTGLVWWSAAVGSAVALTQLTGWNRTRWVAIGQSLTPAFAATGVAVGAIGVRRGNPHLVLAGASTALVLGAVIAPAIPFQRPHPHDEGGRPPDSALSIAHCNALYLNVEHADRLAAALLALDADVLAISEVTPHHVDALVAAGATDTYPHRVGRPARRSEGIMMWSRHPLVDVDILPIDSRPGIVATVAAPAGPVRIVFAHPDPPTMRRGLAQWGSSLEMIGTLGAAEGPPTVVVADCNASRWHPVLRRLLRRGWRDAHELAGRGLSTSWPTGRLMPPFIRLDHALLRDDLELIDVCDFDAPGSDHRGFVVTVAARPRPTSVAPAGAR